jgi:hypothetical protein
MSASTDSAAKHQKSVDAAAERPVVVPASAAYGIRGCAISVAKKSPREQRWPQRLTGKSGVSDNTGRLPSWQIKL